jgi:hypothetical protein
MALKRAIGENNIQYDLTAFEDEAMGYVDRAIEQEWPYDAALIDFQLPDPVTGGFRMALSVCKHIMNTMPKALVIHMTGYLDDPEIRDNVREMNLERVGPKELDFAKGSSSYDIVKALKAHLFGSPIRRQLDELFGGWEDQPYMRRPFAGRAGSPGARGVTHRIAALTRDITTYWDDLPDDLQARIRTIFYIDPVTHKASLVGPRSAAH